MTNTANVLTRSRTRALTRDELRKQLLALVLAAVLAWYTFVIPADAVARGRVEAKPEDEERGGEVRGAGASVFGVAPVPAHDERASGPVEDLDWPEYIYPD